MKTMQCYTCMRLKYSISWQLLDYPILIRLAEDCLEPGLYCSYFPPKFHMGYLNGK